MRTLLRGIYRQAGVVHAVALRETRTRFGVSRLGYIWAFIEPAAVIGVFWAMMSVASREGPYGMAILPFLATGILTYNLVLQTCDRVAGSIESNIGLLFYPHVQPIDLMLARGGLEIATTLTVFAFLLGGLGLYYGEIGLEDPLKVLMGLGLAGLLGITLGMIFCALQVLSTTVDRVKGHIMRPLFWLSGVFFAAMAFPSHIRHYLMWNPILHCTEMVRDGWFSTYTNPEADPLYVCYWILGFAFIGLTLERKVRPKIELS